MDVRPCQRVKLMLLPPPPRYVMSSCQPLCYLQIEPTTRCNYTCGFCAGRHLVQQDLELAAFTRLIDSLDDLAHVELQGEGEPLLHPDLFAMMRHLRARFPAVRISLITNGSLFTAENVAALLECRVDSIMVSLESADSDTFRAIRGGRLERVKRGIALLLERRRALGLERPLLGFAVTLLRQSCDGIGDIASLYRELGLDGGIMMQPLQKMEAYARYYDTVMAANLLQPDDVGRINRIIASDGGLRAALQRYRQIPNFYSELYARDPADPPTCPWLERGLFVSAGGQAASCCYIKHAEQDGFGPVDGNWQQMLDRRAAALEQLRAGNVPGQCSGCGLAARMRQYATQIR